MSSYKRRDFLRGIEQQAQELWETHHVYEVEHEAYPNGSTVVDSSKCLDEKRKQEKFFVTFPYCYMNGRLHIGHAFSLSKSEFRARYEKLRGKHVLWPLGFHCTGMPIKACADKLRIELEQGDETGVPTTTTVTETEISEMDLKAEKTFSSKKSKAAAKTGSARTQSGILESMGIPAEEIPEFADPLKWVRYFPPKCREDVGALGAAIDWRRSFVTTDINPYYDSFIRWQFNTLNKRDKIKFGLRPAVFSRLERQPCADHDRASGENVNPQEYTLIKQKVQRPFLSSWLEKCPIISNKDIYLCCATLRPETMYGQTNCFVLPEADYGFYLAFDEKLKDATGADSILEKQVTEAEAVAQCNSVYVCSARAAANMGVQGILPVRQSLDSKTIVEPVPLFVVKGQELIGVPITAPLAKYPTIYVLPMTTISMSKGTGIVTSVPSDAPDDYAALHELQAKEKIRNDFNVKLEWCQFEPVEIIEIPGHGRKAAVDLCEELGVKSSREKDKLTKIKEITYKKGFYEGVLIVGEFAGQKVCDAKDLVRNQLIARGDAVSYFEPEREVISRSNDHCVVALCNQWYLDYGEANWTNEVKKHVEDEENFNTYNDQTRAQFQFVAEWIKDWACSRHYGLGSLIPWEKERGNSVLIESLSDSTIYFAYYTICHMLHKDYYGQEMGSLQIPADHLTDSVYDYIFLQRDTPPTDSAVSLDKLNTLRESFRYWYPMDLRCSGKDLIFNHLTMALFNHVAVWPDKREETWPRGMYANGHILLDAQKMSKSTGNFLTLHDSIAEYTADGTRIALADAGDGMDDANFSRETANAALMKLYLLCEFAEETVQKFAKGELRRGEKTYFDLCFENELAHLALFANRAYSKMLFRDGVKFGFYDCLSLKDWYRQVLPSSIEFHEETIMGYLRWQSLLMCPIAPHVAEYIWSNLLKNTEMVVSSRIPEGDTTLSGKLFDPIMHRQYDLLADTILAARRQLDKSTGKKKGKVESQKPTDAVLFVAKKYLPWQEKVLQILQSLCAEGRQDSYIEVIRENQGLKDSMATIPKGMQLAMAFASFQMKEEVPIRGKEALELELPFDEKDFFVTCQEYLSRALNMHQVVVYDVEDEISISIDDNKMLQSAKELARPSRPGILFCSL